MPMCLKTYRLHFSRQRHFGFLMPGKRCLISLGLLLLFSASGAWADTCSSLQKQIQAQRAGQSADAVVAQLRRQDAALRQLELRSQCMSAKASRGGLFNSCRGLAGRRKEVQKQIAEVRGAGRGSSAALAAKYRALGCAASARKRTQQRAAERGQKHAARPRIPSLKHTMLFCVRLSDGYYFPAPNSQFVGLDRAYDSLKRCQFICETAAMDVYALEDMSLETAEMVSVRSGGTYSELSVAFRYRGTDKFKACNFARYYERARQERARHATVANLKDVVLPLPSARP